MFSSEMNLSVFLKEKIKIYSLYFYLTTFFNVVFILFSISLLNDEGMHGFINSDTLTLPSIYYDIIELGNTFNGWNLNPAPNFFPDMVLYTLIAPLSSNFIVATILFAIVQYLLIIYLGNSVLKTFTSKKERYYILTIGNLLLALIPLTTYFTNDFSFSFHLISNSFHNGAFINSLIALNLFIRYIQKKSFYNLLFLLLLLLVGIISDRFLIFYYVVPSFAVVVFSLLDKGNKKTKYIYLISLVLTTVLAYKIFNYLKAQKILVVFNRELELTPQIIIDAWNIFAEQFSYYLGEFDSRSFALYFSILSLFLLGRYIYKQFKNKAIKTIDSKFLLILFLFCFILVVLFVPVLLGVYTGWDTIRYNFQTIIIGLLFIGVTINYSSIKTKKALKFILTPVFLITLIFSCTILFSNTFYTGLNKVVNFYPKKVETIDKIAKKYNLKFGVAPYWTAKYTTMLSKENIRAYTCFPEMTPWYHACNENWFYFNPYTKDSVNFNFVVIDSPEHEKNFNEILGKPLKIVDTNGVKIYITKPFRYNPKTYFPYYIKN